VAEAKAKWQTHTIIEKTSIKKGGQPPHLESSKHKKMGTWLKVAIWGEHDVPTD